MENNKVLNYLREVLKNIPTDWLNLTTHRLDIYNESLAKAEFIEKFEELFNANNYSTQALSELPTAYDYIRLGHPLSSVLEWVIAKLHDTKSQNVISFSSKTIPVMAVLRKNLLENKNTRIFFTESLPQGFDAEVLKTVYGYNIEVTKIETINDISRKENTSTVFINQPKNLCYFNLNTNLDFVINTHPNLGSILFINGKENEEYISEIQHVRRRETIAMTPSNCLTALASLLGEPNHKTNQILEAKNKASVLNSIKEITNTNVKGLVASSGLSTQYAIMMGLIHHALENHPGKEIKIVVPPNCYGGTNDQARRIAACINNVEIVDLPVDGDNDMVQSVEIVLSSLAQEDAVPFIIAEIPTNPRVEVPDLEKLKEALGKSRKTPTGETAIEPVFILDQTFCPNVHFLGENNILNSVKTISYVSGSKFPSGGKCTAGYLVSNQKAKDLMAKIEQHLILCDNEATPLQMEILAKQMPSMNQRIEDAYKNTREFVTFIHEVLPAAKINFVSEELAEQGFTPSVFSLDLPTKGNTPEERELYKREQNLRLINLMINKIPNESKYCVSYGQLKGGYWTIPATSTQGTTKEADKDYIARVALSANMDLPLHKKVFLEFVEGM